MDLISHLRFLQKELFSVPTVGLDISDASFHGVDAKRQPSGFFKIEWAHTHELPAGLIDRGEIKQEQELSKILRACAQEDGFPSHSAIVASLPEEKAFLKMIQIPRIENPEELHNAVRFEAETNIPLSGADMYFDYEDITPRGAPQDHYDIAVIAYPKALIDSYVRVITGAGFELAALELESQSVIRCLFDLTAVAESAAAEPVMIIDIGRTKSGFSIFGGGSVIFTSTLPVGGRDFEKALSDHLGIDADAAEKLKKEEGLSGKGDAHHIMQSFVSVIIDEAKKNLEFYETHPRHTHGAHRPVAKIILCGGDSYLLGFPEELSLRTGLSAEYGHPLRAFQGTSSAFITEHDALTFTTALGCAIRDEF